MVWNSSNRNGANRSEWQFGWWKFVVKGESCLFEFTGVFAVFIIWPNVHLITTWFSECIRMTRDYILVPVPEVGPQGAATPGEALDLDPAKSKQDVECFLCVHSL